MDRLAQIRGRGLKWADGHKVGRILRRKGRDGGPGMGEEEWGRDGKGVGRKRGKGGWEEEGS